MSILKCKMCGGDIELSSDKTFGTCENCGCVMTFPKISDEAKADAFNRGNYFRRLGEFDKALQVYEHIVQEEPGNAEAHWCCALCRFGIEYVEDPVTMEYLPTCHRASFDIFTEDIDYLAAVENADGITRKQYQKDAAKITEVQRGILATSQNEKPFDVFICYKESDENGGRTVDSTLAQEIYYQLTDAGLRVFFSRITLEDKAGSEYEPYIFAALHSTKAMVCVATKAEHLNSVWVKNEWSRFLALMRKDRSKVLLPCYRDMNPYDMPEQLSVLQSYDMSKIGFMQDLIRGIKKITATGEPKPVVKETVVVNAPAATAPNVAPLLERAFMFLEDGKWAEADEYCERVLDAEPKNAEAYLGKLMAELEVRTKDGLKNKDDPFDNSDNCIKASRFDADIAKKLKADNSFIREKNEKERTRVEQLESSFLQQNSKIERSIINLQSIATEQLKSLEIQINQKEDEFRFLSKAERRNNQEMNEEINSLKDKYVDLYDFYDNKEKALKELQKQLNTSFETAVESNQTLSFESFDKKRNAIVSEADYLPNENLNPAYNLSSVESNCIYICPYCSTETKANSNIDGNNVFCTNCGQIFKINESSDDITPEESEELNSRNYTKSFDKGSRIKKAVAVILIGAIIVTIITLINLFK